MIRVVGDVHGLTHQYVNLVKDSEYSIQIGDMGFDYSALDFLNNKNHKFFGGNHDNYDFYEWNPYSLGHFGQETLGDLDFYFIRGGFSIDAKSRLMQEELYNIKSWWREEQLSESQMQDALDGYKKAKPDFMFSHTCPKTIVDIISNPQVLKFFGFDPETFNTRTQELLDKCLEVHQPDVWIFGHFHRTIDFMYKNTRFICLGELRYIDIDTETMDIINNNKLDSVKQCG